MRTLLRTTASLLRRYPILWLPVAIAEIINFNIRWLENLLLHRITPPLIIWLTQTHSVLTDTPDYAAATPAVTRKVIALMFPITFSTQLLSIFILASTLVAIATILQSIAQTDRGTLRAGVAAISASSYRILIFSLKLFALGLVSGTLISFLSPLVMSINFQPLETYLEKLFTLTLQQRFALEESRIPYNLLGHFWVLPISLCVAYIITPLQLRLMQPSDFVPTPDQKRQARHAALLIAVVISVLSFLTSTLEISLFRQYHPSGIATYLLRTITSFIIALPYIPLYIAFYLIANPSNPFLPTPPEDEPIPTT